MAFASELWENRSGRTATTFGSPHQLQQHHEAEKNVEMSDHVRSAPNICVSCSKKVMDPHQIGHPQWGGQQDCKRAHQQICWQFLIATRHGTERLGASCEGEEDVGFNLIKSIRVQNRY